MIADGRVTVSGAPSSKAARLVAAGEPVLVAGPGPRYVSRGGEKLAAALEQFGIAVTGTRAIDVGSSTGGFTDCLLQSGATSVVALDVGTHQLHEHLRSDPRVEVHERTNVRDVDPGALGAPFAVLVADLSFISLTTVAPALRSLLGPGGEAVLLVKPQFEAGRAIVSKGRGVVTDPDVWADVLERVGTRFAELGAAIMGVMRSPLRGADGNVEFLLWLQLPEPGATIQAQLTPGDLRSAGLAPDDGDPRRPRG
jgi:23S rRNA (cytidine1920-2'-O)/16S rRNA (cytidine1409-2'-O)-methyltransferase